MVQVQVVALEVEQVVQLARISVGKSTNQHQNEERSSERYDFNVRLV